MTLKEMKQIRKKIKQIKDRISMLEGMATNTSVQLSFAPKAGNHHDKIGEYAATAAKDAIYWAQTSGKWAVQDFLHKAGF